MSDLEAVLRDLDELLVGLDETEDLAGAIQRVKAVLHERSPWAGMPVDNVQWVPAAMVRANDYNPNSVARQEMQLLHTSVDHDGYTQPIVTVWDPDLGVFVIVDGFHRYYVGTQAEDIAKRIHGYLPIVVIDKSINDRMASTVRHNRARGRHSIDGMSSMIFQMLEGGWTDAEICNELGLEPEELLRLKHITGFSKLFEDTEYKMAWVSKRQVRLAVEAGAEVL